MSNLGSSEILVIGVVLLLLFGNKRVKEFAKKLGKSEVELKKIQEEYKNVLTNSVSKEDEEKEEEVAIKTPEKTEEPDKEPPVTQGIQDPLA